MKKPEKKKINPIKIWSTIAMWIVLVGGGTFHVFQNGTLMGGLDSTVHDITVSELKAGERPGGRHVRLSGGLLSGGAIELTTTQDNIEQGREYYYPMYDAAAPNDSVSHVIVYSENDSLPQTGAFIGQMGFPENGFQASDWLLKAFADGNVDLSKDLMWFEEGTTQLDDLIYAVIVLFIVLLISISITYGLFKDDVIRKREERKNPIPEIPNVVEDIETLEKQLLPIAIKYAPEDKEDEIDIYTIWNDIRKPVAAEWNRGGSESPVPQDMLEVLTKLCHRYYQEGEDIHSLRFDVYYNEDKEKWSLRKF